MTVTIVPYWVKPAKLDISVNWGIMVTATEFSLIMNRPTTGQEVKMRSRVVAIIGAGPVGGILAAHLCTSGHTVLLADNWKEHIERIRAGGLHISGREEMLVYPQHLYDSVATLGDIMPEFVFFCTKGHVLDDVLSEMSDALKKSSAVFISAQNGLDTEEIITRYIERRRVLRAVISYAGVPMGPGEIYETFFNPPNYVGWLEESGEKPAREAAAFVSACGLEMEATAEIKKFVWKKSILNSCTMAIAALTGMNIKETLEFPPTRRLVELLLNEGISIAASLGYDYGSDFFEMAMDFNTRAGPHRPSMLVDLENGRKTENPLLIRRIAEYADQQGVPAPVHRTMANLIDALEMRRRSGWRA